MAAIYARSGHRYSHVYRGSCIHRTKASSPDGFSYRCRENPQGNLYAHKDLLAELAHRAMEEDGIAGVDLNPSTRSWQHNGGGCRTFTPRWCKAPKGHGQVRHRALPHGKAGARERCLLGREALGRRRRVESVVAATATSRDAPDEPRIFPIPRIRAGALFWVRKTEQYPGTSDLTETGTRRRLIRTCKIELRRRLFRR